MGSARESINMAEDGDIEFSVAEDRRYTKEHLWLQVIDRDEDEDGTYRLLSRWA